MTGLVPIDQTRAGIVPSQRMRDRMAQGQGTADNFSAGTSGGFPVLSIRASKFHLRFGDNERTITDPATGYPVAFLDVVLINASKQLAKAYYEDAYSQGANEQPDCWSMDSVRPDPSVQRKVNPTCQDCPKNAFGSRITPTGKAAKACSDHRRMAVSFTGELVKPDPTVILLRVPQSSLKNLANYVSMLARNGYEPGGCVTRLSFDPDPSFPKLQFVFVGPLSEDEFTTTEALAGAPNTKAMLHGQFGQANPQLTQQPLTPIARQAPITVADSDDDDSPFGPGMLQQGSSPSSSPSPSPSPSSSPTPTPSPAPSPSPSPAPTPPSTAPSGIIALPDGKFFDPATGQYVEAPKPQRQVDPDVLVLPDGKFFHKLKGSYVDSQYLGAAEAPAVTAKPAPVAAPVADPVEVKAKRTRKPKAAAAPAAEPADEPEEQVTNGQVVEKPTVIAASPKLEELLGGLMPKK